MSTVPLLIVQPDADGPAGPLGDWLTEAGATVTVCRPWAGEPIPADLTGYRALVVLGGGMGALDDTEYPWLAEVRALLAGAVTNRVPTLAVCLGAQLLAVAVGGQTRPIPAGPEIGTRLVAKRDTAAQDPLWADLPLSPDVLQFHHDEVHVLPAGAVLLASSPACPNQAYRVGPTGYAVQFHIETTPETVRQWADNTADVPDSATRQFTPEHLAQAHQDIAETWQPFAERFVRLAAGDLAPARASLPLAH